MHSDDAGTMVRAPLGQGRLLLPLSSRADAVAGLTLLNPNRRAALVAARAYAAWIAVAGPRLSGRGGVPLPGIIDSGDVLAAVGGAIGPFTGLAVIDPRQTDRPRAALMAIRDGIPVAFVKVNRHPDELVRERTVLELLVEGGVNVRTPRVIAHGNVDGVEWMATTAMSSPWTRPMTRLPNGWRTGREFDVLETFLGPRPFEDAVPLHGDLTPWNLRHCAGEPWLLDWEDVAWGPAGADEAYFHATATSVCGADLRPAPPAAVEHWLGVVGRRTATGPEQRMKARLLETLQRMAPPGGAPPSGRG